MIRRGCISLGALLFWVVCSSISGFGQRQPEPYWALLMDPVCPVTSLFAPNTANATKELRVLYYPANRQAQLRSPSSLSLQVGFDNPQYVDSSVSVPFKHKSDYWEAKIPLEKARATYAIFSVKDPTTNQIDDNHGKFWDVVFCDSSGEKDPNGLRLQAQSYAGGSWPTGIHRRTDYAKAVSILKGAISENSSMRRWSTSYVSDLWNYEALRDGGDDKAWAKVASEIDQFITQHTNQKPQLLAAGNFIVNHQRQLPSDFVERTVTVLDDQEISPNNTFHSRLEFNRAEHETDLHKRIAALDA